MIRIHSFAPARVRLRTRLSTSFALSAALVALGCSSDDDGDSDDDAATQTTVVALSPEEEQNLVVAKRVLQEGLIGGDTAVINELVREDYIQHNAQANDGRAGLLAFVGFLQTQPGNAVEFHRELADGDYVALHSTYGTGAGRTVAFDVFRLENGQLAEHWDALQPWVDASETASGNTLVDGETEVTDRRSTDRNRTLVTNMLREVFVEGDVGRLPVYVDTNNYVQHNPQAPNGLEGLIEFFLSARQQGIEIGYTRSPLVVADGNFVLVGSEGYYGTRDDYAVFYDLFRVERERIVEHWDVIPPSIDLDAIPHDNGLF